MKTLLTALLFLLPAALFAADPVKHVKADDAAKIIAEGNVTIVDVRTPDEFKDGHIKGAKNIDIMSDDFQAQLAKLDKTKPTLVHCQAGGRSTRSLPIFQKLGFTHLIHLDEGFGGWEAAGKPVEK
ncbi:MAG: rhodanese-like domain-containing protein [Prosthecobacter sp.]|jgi:rhodanese-related sulfurtransferase|uniref:rhodanese-like domain-containing protein n=1 Tax=Prosthecobacter sp. TaxID=1965333 RepID=UPI0019F354C5|nr:rhodanese-like domain-containing protein [Prosthecobacter sp.]MBE2282397.1 rhodanese-like domain-containing protein [Prosthecobacter sp.]